MSLPDSEQKQLRPTFDGTAEKHGSPPTCGRWDVELDATRQARPISGFWITALQPFAWYAFGFQLLHERTDRGAAGVARVTKILGQLALIHMNRKDRSR